jgi:hypothetical protein
MSRLSLQGEIEGQPVRFYADLPTRDVVNVVPGEQLRVSVRAEHVRAFPAEG